MALSLGSRHRLVLLSHFIEKYFGKLASTHFCVTKAMAIDLKENWGIQ